MPFPEPNDPMASGSLPKKSAVRTEVRNRLRSMHDRAARSARLCAVLARHPRWIETGIVGMFAPLSDEPDIDLLCADVSGKILCYPVMQREELHFMAVA